MNESSFTKELIEDLSHPMLWKYRMHVLNKAREDSTKLQIFASLKDYLISIGNFSMTPFLEKVRQRDYTGPLIYRNTQEELQLEQKSLNRETAIYKRQEKEVDYSVTASAQIRQLKFWNALQNYKRDIRLRSSQSTIDKYYEQRAILHLILDEYRKAYSLAKKADAYELMVVISFIQSDFRNVLKLFEHVVMQIENTPITIVSRFELFLMIGLSFLAKWNFYEDNNEIFDEYMTYIEGDKKYDLLVQTLKQFRKKQFVDSLKSFKEISNFSYLSLYMSISWSDLVAEINKNTAAHCVLPYSSISFDEIHQQTGLSKLEMPLILSEAIADGIISGRIDVCAKIFTATGRENEKQQQQIKDAVENLKTMIQEGLWKADTYKKIKKITKQRK